MGEGEIVIGARRLTRHFGMKAAVRDLDLAVPRGSVFALLGRNGAGKTTAIRMLLGLLEPTRGSAEVLGAPSRHIPPEVRGRIGYLTEGHPLIGWMRVGELGRFQSRFYPSWNDGVFRAVTGHFRLDPRARAGTLSRGERAGLCLALTLAPEPDLLVLDDPALGLDPVARRSLLEALIYSIRKEGRTILFSSHLLSDVERVADHVAVLDGGVLRAHCPMETFRSRVRRYVLKFPGDPPRIPDFPGFLQSVRGPRDVAATVVAAGEGPPEALRGLGAAIEEIPLSLEDAFLAYLGDRGERTLLAGEPEDRLTAEVKA
jgi:ABC-2 type transport system ATP-binding protein